MSCHIPSLKKKKKSVAAYNVSSKYGEIFSGYFISAFPFFSRKKAGQRPFTIYEDVVLRLLRAGNALGKGHHLYTDNYYTCVPMLQELSMDFKTYCCGTIRANRKYTPDALKAVKGKVSKVVNTGDAQFQFSRNMVMVAWYDNRIVRVLSSIHDSTMTTCKRNPKRSEKTGTFQGNLKITSTSPTYHPYG